MKLVVAEKPAVARDIARVLGATKRCVTHLEGNDYQVTWAVGHLLEIAAPQDMDPAWKRWSLASLPMVPSTWERRPRDDDKAKKQLKTVCKLMKARKTSEIICATDAGREGEHIFRLIYAHSGSNKPVRRLWISSLTEEAIRRGFEQLRPAADFDGLAAAAEGRDRADWLVGMSLTRLYSLLQEAGAQSPKLVHRKGKPGASKTKQSWSVGRVQTPTLRLVVARDLVRKHFAKTPYQQLQVSFETED